MRTAGRGPPACGLVRADLIGPLGEMASGGILGLLGGATLLALGHQIFMSWVAAERTR